MTRAPSQRILGRMTVALLLAMVGMWAVYLAVGQRLIRAVHGSESLGIAWGLMKGRAVTGIEDYLRSADQVMLLGTFWVVVLYFAVVLTIKEPGGVILSVTSTLVLSFLLFSLFEILPALSEATHLGIISGYHAYWSLYDYDEELGWRGKPSQHIVYPGFRGANYSPRFRIDVPPETIEWITDERGFRSTGNTGPADVVILGDSYMEYGQDEADTFPKRLEARLPGSRIANLSKSGYGPFQYLVMLKRFGLEHRPRLALLALYEGNDLTDTRDYLGWKRGTGRTDEVRYGAPGRPFMRRYWIAIKATAIDLRKAWRRWSQQAFEEVAHLRGYGKNIHPDVAFLKFGDRGTSRMLLWIDLLGPASTKEILASEEGLALQQILRDFRDTCRANKISPVVLYIPSPVHIYAPYSTKASGRNWLGIRDAQIMASSNLERAVEQLGGELNLRLIDLTSAFEQAAEEGRLLYYPLDAHWNTDGRELAAATVAKALKGELVRP